MGSAPEPPSLPAAPEFRNSYVYDEEGRLTGSTEKDASGNIVYRPRVLTGAEQVQKRGIESTKQTLLQRLYSTPEEYTRAAQQEADAFSIAASKVAGEQFTKDVTRIGEVSNVRGLLGSKAYADIMGQREKTQAEQTASIGQQATAMRESLIQAKKGMDYNLYNLYSRAGDDYSQKAMQGLQASAGLGSQLNLFNQAAYAQQIQAQQQQYANQMAQWSANEPWRNYIMPVLGTGAMLWGGGAFGGPASKASDRRLKKNIVPLFKIDEVQWYAFEYDLSKWPEGVLPAKEGIHIGVMADEVKHISGAVSAEMFHGYDMVNYEVVRRHLKMENA